MYPEKLWKPSYSHDSPLYSHYEPLYIAIINHYLCPMTSWNPPQKSEEKSTLPTVGVELGSQVQHKLVPPSSEGAAPIRPDWAA